MTRPQLRPRLVFFRGRKCRPRTRRRGLGAPPAAEATPLPSLGPLAALTSMSLASA